MAEYQAKASKDASRDPFRISSEWSLISRAMGNAGLDGHPGGYTKDNLKKVVGPFGQRNLVNKDRGLKEFTERFAMAGFGGVALVGPMLLMVLHKGQTTSLATTSVAVFLFAAVVAYKSRATPEAIVSAVAAYAAVLVVFVGAIQ